MFVLALACLWLVPQAQAQRMPYSYDRARAQLLGMAWQSCNSPYPPSYCFEGGGYYSPYNQGYDRNRNHGRMYPRRGRGTLGTIVQIGVPIAAYAFGEHRGRERGRREGYQAASYEAAAREEQLRELHEIRRQEAAEREQEQSRERQGSRDLIPMTNKSHFLAVIYDGDTEVARLEPGDSKNFPEPKDGYRAKLRTIVRNRVHYKAVEVSHNETHSGWEINEPEKE